MTSLNKPVRREIVVGSRSPTVYIVTMDRAGLTLRQKGKRKGLDTVAWGKIELIAADLTGRRIMAERKAAKAERKLLRGSRR